MKNKTHCIICHTIADNKRSISDKAIGPFKNGTSWFCPEINKDQSETTECCGKPKFSNTKWFVEIT